MVIRPEAFFSMYGHPANLICQCQTVPPAIINNSSCTGTSSVEILKSDDESMQRLHRYNRKIITIDRHINRLAVYS